jgi:hypothetical protein
MANPFPFVAGEVLTAADMNGIGEWTSYTPILTATTTNPTLGAGSVATGSYARVQNLIVYKYFVQFGTSGVSAGTGNYKISLPVPALAITQFYDINNGSGAFFDNSGNVIYYAHAWIADVNNLSPLHQLSFNGAIQNISATAPVVPAASDALSGLVIYRAA